MDAYLAAVSYHVPGRYVPNEAWAGEIPAARLERLGKKLGVRGRYVAAEDECASDLALRAAQQLLEALPIERSRIDFLLFCTQSPDYALPSTACILQDRLGLPTSCGALDFNLGCSAYPYGLGLAKGLIAAGIARNVLLLTGETYTKFLAPDDHADRLIFGDGASASWITASPQGSRIGACTFGTDGSGAQSLIVPGSGCRRGPSSHRGQANGGGLSPPSGHRIELRSPSAETDAHQQPAGSPSKRAPVDGHLHMDGPEVFRFGLQRVPQLLAEHLEASGLSMEEVDRFVLHQANAHMNERLRLRANIPSEKAPDYFEGVGNTVSATIPIVLCEASAAFREREKVILLGFGVGFSWGACTLDWGEILVVRPSDHKEVRERRAERAVAHPQAPDLV